jgi:hypothetical protein
MKSVALFISVALSGTTGYRKRRKLSSFQFANRVFFLTGLYCEVKVESITKYLVSPKAKINIRHNLIEYVFVRQYLKSRTDELQQSDPERDADLHFCCTSCLPNSKSAVSNEVDLVCFILSDDAAATATAFRNDKQLKF